jgi:hypothetical protein
MKRTRSGIAMPLARIAGGVPAVLLLLTIALLAAACGESAEASPAETPRAPTATAVAESRPTASATVEAAAETTSPAPEPTVAPVPASPEAAATTPTPEYTAIPETEVSLGLGSESGEMADSTIIRRLMDAITRNGMGPYEIGLEAVYGHPALMKALGQTGLAEEGLIFFLSESIHDNLILTPSPTTILTIDGGPAIEPTIAELTFDDFHHRTSRFVFAIGPEALASLNDGAEHVLRLKATIDDGFTPTESVFTWRLPMRLPDIPGYTDW